MPRRSDRTDLIRGLGLAIRERRGQLNLTQDELASATGVARQRISALERGLADPRYELLLALADALEVKAGALIVRAEALSREQRRSGRQPPAA